MVTLAPLIWEPPDGMLSEVRAAWRQFYRQAASGAAGYTITPYEYRLLYIAQKGRCWICRTAKGIHPDDPKGGGTRRLGVDHDHLTGRIRGILCTGGDRTCNRMLGWLKDNPAAFRRAAGYLEEPPARVLAEMRRVRAEAEAAGATWTPREEEKLAVSFLWPVTTNS